MNANRVKQQLLCFVLSVFLTVQASGCSVLFKQEESSQTNQSQDSVDPQNMKITEARDFHEGYAWVKSSNALCLIDKTGKIINTFPAKYSVCKDFCNGLSAIDTESHSKVLHDYVNPSDNAFVVNTSGETVFTISQEGFRAYNGYAHDNGESKLRYSSFDGLDSHSVIVDKNFDDFERSGNYLCHYNIDTKALTEITPYDYNGTSKNLDIGYLADGYYYMTADYGDWDNPIHDEILKFYNYNSKKTLSFRNNEAIEKVLGKKVYFHDWEIQPYDNGKKAWACIRASSSKPEDPDESVKYVEKKLLFDIDLINETCDYIPLEIDDIDTYSEQCMIPYCRMPDYIIPLILSEDQSMYVSPGIEGEIRHIYDFKIGETIDYLPEIDYQCYIKEYANRRFLSTTKNNNDTEFFTIITDNKPLFTPKKYSEQTALIGDYVVFDSDEGVQIMNLASNSVQSTISNSKLVYSDRTNSIIWVSDNTNTYTECYDITTGKVLFKLNESVTALSDFSDDMVPVQSSSGNALYYVNKSGKKLEIH